MQNALCTYYAIIIGNFQHFKDLDPKKKKMREREKKKGENEEENRVKR